MSGLTKVIDALVFVAFGVVLAWAVHAITDPNNEQPKPATCYEVQLLTQAPDGTRVGAAAVVCYKQLEQQQGVTYIGTETNPTISSNNRGVR